MKCHYHHSLSWDPSEKDEVEERGRRGWQAWAVLMLNAELLLFVYLYTKELNHSWATSTEAQYAFWCLLNIWAALSRLRGRSAEVENFSNRFAANCLQVWPPTAALVFRFPHLLNMETEMLRRWRRVRRKASVCARPRCIKAPLGVGFIVRHHRRGWNVQNQCLPTTLWLLFRPKNHMDLPKAMGRVHEAEYM